MTLLSDKLSLIGLLVILLEVALVVLVVSPEQARRARVAEQETATAVFGAPLAARARAFAELLDAPLAKMSSPENCVGVFPSAA